MEDGGYRQRAAEPAASSLTGRQRGTSGEPDVLTASKAAVSPPVREQRPPGESGRAAAGPDARLRYEPVPPVKLAVLPDDQ